MLTLSDVEFSKFSQNGEDGIIEHLISKLVKNDRFFVEIGCGNGKENNTTHLYHCGWKGVVFDEKKIRIEQYLERKYDGVFAFGMKCSPEKIKLVLKRISNATPDLFSLDIDSFDYDVLKALLMRGFRPSIIVVEYNATLGPALVWKYPYPPAKFSHPMFYGASVMALRRLLKNYGYSFVTVDSHGVNAFFVRKNSATEIGLDGLAFSDNEHHCAEYGSWKDRLEELKSSINRSTYKRGFLC